MKKFLVTLLIVAAIACATVIGASASNYDYCAEELYNLGLLKGTEAGFDLDRVPTRADAIVMLIRLNGFEEAALAGEYETPFTDVPEWAEKYVGYAYENGLTGGTTETTFGTAEPCSAQMYVTLVLRALGYSDADGDFTYSNAIEFGKSLNVVDEFLAGGTFLRDQMVAVSYLALAAQPKDGDYVNLLEKLVSDGAVAAEASSPLADKIDLYEEFLNVGSELNDEKSLSLTGTMDMEMSLMGQATALEFDIDMNLIMENNDILASILMEFEADGEKMPIECYISDGYIYTNSLGDKMRMSADFSELLAIAEMGNTSTNPIYIIKEISKTSEDGLTAYTVELSDGFLNDALDQIMAMMSGGGLEESGLSDLTYDGITMTVYADASGALKKMAMSLGMSIDMATEGMNLSILVNMSAEFEITATGSDVKVTLPDDLDDYIEFDPAA